MPILSRVIAVCGCIALLSGCVNLTQRVIDPSFHETFDPEPPNPTAVVLFSGMVGDVALAAPLIAGGAYVPGLITLGALFLVDVTIWAIRYRSAKKRILGYAGLGDPDPTWRGLVTVGAP